MGIHGGDIYRHPGVLDFSANCNCFGMPDRVREAAVQGVLESDHYPDPECMALREAISGYEDVEPSRLLCGNGSSELLLALVLALKPERALLSAPCFLEYERVLETTATQIRWWLATAEDGDRSGTSDPEGIPERGQTSGDFMKALRATDAGLLILSNPNNPTGALLSPKELKQIIDIAEERGIYLVVDECFLDFVAEPERYSCKQYLDANPHLILLKAFTKTFACAGLRLGYLLCANENVLCNCKKYLSEWNVSLPAAYAGIAAAGERDWLRETAHGIRREREWLREQLDALGWKVYPGKANFLFFTGKRGLYEHCLSRGILIRDCSNYHGLEAGSYRVCVKKREDNEKLLEAIKNFHHR